MAYSIEIKNEVIKKISEGEKIKEISDRMGISVPTIYKWRKENQLDNKNMDDVDLAEQKETSKEIKRLIKLRKFNDAFKYTDKYPDNHVIQSQKVNIYIKKRKYREAKEIGEKFRDNAPIQSQMATIAIKQGDYEKAKEIGEKFRDHAQIQSQMVTIAIQEGDYEKAKKIGKKFLNDEVIQLQIEKIEKKLKKYNALCKENKEKVELLNQIKTKLYYELEKIDLQEILQNKELTEKQKLYVALAINEKRKNVKNIKEIAKRYKDSDEIKNINIILQRTQSKKKKIFDWQIYDVCLGWELDENIQKKYEQNKKKQKESGITQREEKLRTQKHKEEEQQQERKKQNKVREQIIKEKYNVHTNKKISDNNIQKPKVQQFFKSELKHEEKHKNNNDFKNELKVQVQQDTAKIKQQNEEIQQKYIYTEVMEYLIEKRKSIYVKMQSKDLEKQREGISQWDKLDDLIEKIKELKENEDYMKNIYERVARLKEKEENQIRR